MNAQPPTSTNPTLPTWTPPCPDDATRKRLHGWAADPGGYRQARQPALYRLAAHWPDDRTRALLTDLASDEDPVIRESALYAMASAWPDDRTRALLHTRAPPTTGTARLGTGLCGRC